MSDEFPERDRRILSNGGLTAVKRNGILGKVIYQERRNKKFLYKLSDHLVQVSSQRNVLTFGYKNSETIFHNFGGTGNMISKMFIFQNCWSGMILYIRWIQIDPAVNFEVSTITYTTIYTLKTDVCRQAFLSIHSVSEKQVRTVLEKWLLLGQWSLTKEERNHQVIKSKIFVAKDYIGSLAIVSSHYRRAKSPFWTCHQVLPLVDVMKLTENSFRSSTLEKRLSWKVIITMYLWMNTIQVLSPPLWMGVTDVQNSSLK